MCSSVGLALMAIFLSAEPAGACAVCYGAADSAMTKGVNNGIMALLGVIAAVQIGFVALFISIRQRGRNLDRRNSRVEVIQEGAN